MRTTTDHTAIHNIAGCVSSFKEGSEKSEVKIERESVLTLLDFAVNVVLSDSVWIYKVKEDLLSESTVRAVGYIADTKNVGEEFGDLFRYYNVSSDAFAAASMSVGNSLKEAIHPQ